MAEEAEDAKRRKDELSRQSAVGRIDILILNQL